MAGTEILAPRNKPFERQVQKLAEEGAGIIEAYGTLTSRMLEFARSFKEATDRARVSDEGEEGIHSTYLKESIAEVVSTTNASIWSRWNTIGTYADKLIDYSISLPPQRDSLYEIALALKEKKPVQKWIEAEKITVDSSVRDVRTLRKPVSKRAKATKRPATKSSLNAEVVLRFSTYEEAAEALTPLLMSSSHYQVEAHQAFSEALRSKLKADDFAKIKKHFRQ